MSGLTMHPLKIKIFTINPFENLDLRELLWSESGVIETAETPPI